MKTISLAILPGSFIFAQQKPAPLISDYLKANISAPPATSSDKVPDAALLVARDIAIHMLSTRVDIREYMATHGFRVAVMAQTEMTTDLTEQRNWKKPVLTDGRLTEGEKKNYERIANMTDKQYWDTRARGMGNHMTSCAEDLRQYDPAIYDLLAKVYPDHHIPMDVFYGENTRPRSRQQ